jgi:hypothetical protein
MNSKMCNLGIFLAYDVGSYSDRFKAWIVNDKESITLKNVTFLEKKQGLVMITDLYSEEKQPTSIVLTSDQFLQILNDWTKAIKSKPQEVIVKLEDGQFILEAIQEY